MLRSHWQALRLKASRLTIVASIVSLTIHGVLFLFFFLPAGREQSLHLTLAGRSLLDMPVQFIITERTNRTVDLQNTLVAHKGQRNAHQSAQSKPRLNNLVEQAAGTIITKKNLPTKKKTVLSKKERTKKTLAKKQLAAKKDEPKKNEAIQKIEPRVPEKKEIALKENVQSSKPEIAPTKEAATLPANPIVNDQEIITVGRQEYDALCLSAVIQSEIERCWRRPAGVRPPRGCIMKVIADDNGKVSTVTVEESSTIITYDIAARMALMQTYMPKEVAGKELIIAFEL